MATVTMGRRIRRRRDSFIFSTIYKIKMLCSVGLNNETMRIIKKLSTALDLIAGEAKRSVKVNKIQRIDVAVAPIRVFGILPRAIDASEVFVGH
jgi:hypothetical protein